MRFIGSLFIFVLTLTTFHPASENVEEGLTFSVDSVSTEFTRVAEENGYPLYYYSDIDRFPCNDSVCKRMQLRIYLDAWGNFLHFSFEKGNELTKINHVAFSDQDYKRLHKLLNNPDAFIQYYKMDDLTEHQSEMHYYSVDAVTSATVSDVNIVYECVKGAVKTCYTLWHFVNNKELKDALKKETLKSLNDINLHYNLQKELITAFENHELLQPAINAQIIKTIDEKNDYHLLSAYREYLRNFDSEPDKSFIASQLNNLNENNLSSILGYNILLLADIRNKKIRQFPLNQYYTTKERFPKILLDNLVE